MNLLVKNDIEDNVFSTTVTVDSYGDATYTSDEEKELLSRKYARVEKVLRENKGVSLKYELKATRVNNAEKGKLFRSLNKYIDETTPWILAKDDSKRDRLATVLYNLIEGIRIGTVLLRPFIPETTEKIFKQINTDNTSYDSVKEFGGYKSSTKVGIPEVLFQRIETK